MHPVRVPQRARFAALLALLALLLAAPAGHAQDEVSQPKAFDGPRFDWPTAGRLTQDYGCTGMTTNPRHGSCPGFHNGVDLANDWGTPIRAAGAGIVEHVGWDPYTHHGARAWVVIVGHGGGLRTWYAHLLPRHIDGANVGDYVEAGQLIGRMGMTGLATGVHLHLMVERGHQFLDPNHWFAGPPPRRLPALWELVPLDEPELGVNVL